MDGPGLFSLGYGNRTMPEFLALLEDWRIATLVDVRSVPFSRFHPEFAKDALKGNVESAGVSYAWMGDTLGGKCGSATPPSKVAFRSALRRLALMGTDRRVAFLCAELRPETCHRVRLLGEALDAAGVAVTHIDEHGRPLSHKEARFRLTHGQVTLEQAMAPIAA
jgi:uncharacterized protein (DUF488 family)